MRYLITGGAGFIGSHLAEALLGAGHQVTAIDDLSTADEKVAHSNPFIWFPVAFVWGRICLRGWHPIGAQHSTDRVGLSLEG